MAKKFNRIFKCIFCGKDYSTEITIKKEHRFCSDECEEKAKSFLERKWQRGQETNCLICGSILSGSKNEMYCSKDCQTKAHRLRHMVYDMERYRSKWWKRKLYSTRRGALRRKISFDDNLLNAELLIPEYCPLLGTKLEIGSGQNSPSIDRIDSSKGYTLDNIWIISRRANTIKNDATLEELELLTNNFRQFMKDK